MTSIVSRRSRRNRRPRPPAPANEPVSNSIAVAWLHSSQVVRDSWQLNDSPPASQFRAGDKPGVRVVGCFPQRGLFDLLIGGDVAQQRHERNHNVPIQFIRTADQQELDLSFPYQRLKALDGERGEQFVV